MKNNQSHKETNKKPTETTRNKNRAKGIQMVKLSRTDFKITMLSMYK